MLAGSLNKNIELAEKIKQEPIAQKEANIVNIVNMNLPIYDSYKEKNDGIPERV
jgi:hypothetical protein